MIETNHHDVVQELPNLDPIPATNAESDREIAARGRELSQRLTWMPALKESDHFAKRFKAVSQVLDTVLASTEDLAPERLAGSEDLQWLHDNARLPRATQAVFQRDSSPLRNAPHVRDGQGAAMPRVLAIAEDYLRVAKCQYSDHSLRVYVDAFQETVPLNMRELWLLPPALQLVLLEEIAARGEKLISQVAEAQQMGVLITSLREVSEAPWKELLEPLIAFDHVLSSDPAKAYGRMDYASRELYRNTVAEYAERSDCSELEIAKIALQMALDSEKQKHADPRLALRRAHVGYYLIGEGAEELRGRAGVNLPWKQRVQNFLRRHPDEFYLGGIEVLTLLIVIAIMTPVYGLFSSFWTRILGILLLILPASQSAVEVMNYLTTALLNPRLLPKFDFADGVPDDCLTMVVIPTLLLNEKQVRRLVDDLEVRYLGNAGANLHYALLSDMPDSEEQPKEAGPLEDLASSLIENLNRKYVNERGGGGSFTLLHRHRIYNPREGVWMGWERKRGKLLDFNRLIRGEYDSFPVKAGEISTLSRIRYVITLDSDTELPRGTAHRLVGAMAHPLNRAIVDPYDNIVTAGYGILQPRVGISVQSASLSRLARMYSGQTGFDIYTRAVSDVYQDLYGDGIFTGKGIYEVDTLRQVLEHRFPRNALLSHDLIEGAYARAGLVSDIEVIDDYPSHYSAYNRRKHRWLRGDWQIVSWLLGKVPDESGRRVRNPISFLSRWKILDNLRRSLVEAGAFLLLLLGWTVLPGRPLYWTLVTIAILFVPPWFQLAFAISRSLLAFSMGPIRDGLAAFGSTMVSVFLTLTFLAHQALLSADAVLRTWYRRMVSRQRLLEWETAAEAESTSKKSAVDVLLSWTPALSLVVGVIVYLARPGALYVALPVLILWAWAKPLSLWLNRSPRSDRRPESRSDRLFLRKAAVHTWRYFAEFSNQEHNWLVPDYVRETPPFVAARVSPTNLGLLLNARQAACELGYLTVPAFVDQTKRTMATVLQLQRQRGHFFNWYDTRTLEPDRPRFISTVDSGNMVASLVTLQQGAIAMLNRPLLDPVLFSGYADHLCALAEMKLLPKRVVAGFEDGHDRWLDRLLEGVELPVTPEGIARAGDAQWFRSQARDLVEQVRDTVSGFMPWLLPQFALLHANPALGKLGWCEDLTLEKLPPCIDLLHAKLLLAHGGRNAVEEAVLRDRLRSMLPAAKLRAQRLIADLRQITDDAGRLVQEMDFRYLYDRRRKLLSIGSDAETGKVHAACYDLLASEARIAAFLAVANDHIPQESWFQLGRSQTVDSGHATLISWTGTMFEYLLPAVWMRWYPETLLQRSMDAALAIQQAHGAEHRVPWGVSECAFAMQDENGVYGYRAFGVPALAVQQEEERLVVAPYATMLALDFDSEAAIKNLRGMNRKGFLGRYGFFEAIDFSVAARRNRREPFVMVQQWMAHHQGMSLLAMTNFLRQGVVRNWFHADARIQATELLLQERPLGRPVGGQAKRRTRKETAPTADKPKSAIAA